MKIKFNTKLISTRELVLFGILGAMVALFQIAFSFLPNIEVVSLFIILFSLIYGKKALFIVYTFVLIMGITYGFGMWWIGYIILWPLLCIITSISARFIEEKYLVLAFYSGSFGLLFGFFYAIPYAIVAGLNAGIVYWIAGIEFDIIHGISNYFIMLLLGEKLFKLLNNLSNKYMRNLSDY